MSPVVVYFYSNEWIPMKCFSLGEAIALYRKASLLGKKIIVYPAYLDPYINRSAAPPCASEEDEKSYRVTASWIGSPKISHLTTALGRLVDA